MCGPHPINTKTERQQLQDAIERLEALKRTEWWPDALLVIGAAKKHLQTLPKPTKFRVTAARRGDVQMSSYNFDTRSDVVAWATTNLWAYDSFNIYEI